MRYLKLFENYKNQSDVGDYVLMKSNGSTTYLSNFINNSELEMQ
jgi:hypothetical protein